MSILRSLLVPTLLAVSACSSAGYYGPVAPAGAPAPQECSVVGSWTGMVQGGVLAGRMVELTFWDNAVARGTSGAIMLEVAWETEGGTLTIVHRDSIPPAAACRVDQVGVYSLVFSDACSRVVATSVDDSCEHRRRTLHDLHARRVQ
jgi:hypothetical protein